MLTLTIKFRLSAEKKKNKIFSIIAEGRRLEKNLAMWDIFQWEQIFGKNESKKRAGRGGGESFRYHCKGQLKGILFYCWLLCILSIATWMIPFNEKYNFFKILVNVLYYFLTISFYVLFVIFYFFVISYLCIFLRVQNVW